MKKLIISLTILGTSLMVQAKDGESNVAKVESIKEVCLNNIETTIVIIKLSEQANDSTKTNIEKIWSQKGINYKLIFKN